jgi:hypothetical protein
MEIVRPRSALLTICKRPFCSQDFEVWGMKPMETQEEKNEKF